MGTGHIMNLWNESKNRAQTEGLQRKLFTLSCMIDLLEIETLVGLNLADRTVDNLILQQ